MPFIKKGEKSKKNKHKWIRTKRNSNKLKTMRDKSTHAASD